MLAYLMQEDGTAQVESVPEPVASKDNLIVKLSNATICGTDFRTFMKGNSKITPPRILGHEMAGTIVHAGELARQYGLNSGDRVTVAPAIGCGQCWPCSTGHTNMCDHLETMGFQYDGAFAEYMAVPAKAIRMGNVIKIPDNLSFEEACLAEPSACVLNAQSYLKIHEGDYVLVYGSGFIGCMHAEFALGSGAEKVIMVEIAEPRIEIAKRLIPNIIMINPSKQDTVREVDALTQGRGANVVITALSVPSVHTEAQIIASKMGRISLFGGLAGESKGFLDSNLIHYKELSVYGVHATSANLVKDVIDRTAAGKIDMKKYISHHVPLANIDSGFAAIRDENAMKVVVNI